MTTKEDRVIQAQIQIDACRQRIELLQKRIDEESRYLLYLREKFKPILEKESRD
jgi:hypothetical protein